MDQRTYNWLSRVLAVIGGLVGVTVILLYTLKPDSLKEVSSTETIAGLGLAAGIYYLSLHQLIRKRYLAASTWLLVLLSLANLSFVLAGTGGLDSPYYAIWILVLVATGFFGWQYTLGAIGITIGFYLYFWAQRQLAGDYFSNHLIQFLITLAAAVLSKLIYWPTQAQQERSKEQVSALSGRLGVEQLKAQVLMSSIGDGVMIMNPNRQIEFFNKAAELMSGWDAANATGLDYRTVLDLTTLENEGIADQTDPFLEALQKRTTTTKNDLSMTSKAGRKIALSISISPIYEMGNLTGGIAIFRDISKEKEVERQRSEFVSTASHEMRTPVAAIEGYLSLAMNSQVATIDERAKSYLQKAHQTTQHLGQLFRDLLSITKIEDGRLQGNKVPVDLGQLLQTAAGELQPAAAKKNLTLIYRPSSATHILKKAITPIYLVLADPQRLTEVVTNLIDNAIKYTGSGGISVSMSGGDNNVTVGISDTGIGIAKEDLEHLFQKFYRVDNSATRTAGGTGLGLYLCRAIIEMYNGRIWAESTPGKGTTFYFSLPRIQQTGVAAAPVQPATPSPAEQVTVTPGATPIPPGQTLNPNVAALNTPAGQGLPTPQVSQTPVSREVT